MLGGGDLLLLPQSTRNSHYDFHMISLKLPLQSPNGAPIIEGGELGLEIIRPLLTAGTRDRLQGGVVAGFDAMTSSSD